MIVLGSASCSSKKSAAATTGYETAEQAKANPKSEPKKPTEFQKLAQSYTPWSDVQMPVTARMISPKKISLSGTAKMINGEAMNVSIRVFGFEVGSMYADTDSLYILVKAADMYYAESMNKIHNRFGVTLADMQSMLLGQAFLPSSGTISTADESNVRANIDGNVLFFTPKKAHADYAMSYTANISGEEAPELATLSIIPAGLQPVDCVFTAPRATDAGAVSPSVEIATTLNKKAIDVQFDWTLSNAKWNSGASISKPKISRSAKRLDAAKILQLLSGLK